ncbi:conserved hypothetical protein, partial [Ixodes scapularis]
MSISNLTVKWAGKEYLIPDLPQHACVVDLKDAIFKKTGVHPERQKLVGMKCKGKPIAEWVRLSDLKMEPNSKIMMIGSLEQNMLSCPPEQERASAMPRQRGKKEGEQSKSKKAWGFLFAAIIRISRLCLRCERQFTKIRLLLFLFADHRSTGQSIEELMRPFLHEFLTSAYEDYDIAFWSATNMKWIDTKLWELGVTRHAEYKICFLLDSAAMISLHTSKFGMVDIKPLALIWAKLPNYRPENTIMFDDIRRNFLMNPQSGLRVSFRQ